MIRRVLGALLVCVGVSTTDAAQRTPIFIRPPNANAAIRDVTAFGAVADYPVTPDVRAIAENAQRDHPAPLMFALPHGRVLKFEERRFEPIDGFTVTAAGEVSVDPNAADADLSFNWYGVGRGAELSFTVHKGRLTGSLTGMLGRKNEAWTIVESRGQRVLREIDSSRFPAPYEDRPLAGKAAATAPLVGEISLEKHNYSRPATVNMLILHTPNAVVEAGGDLALGDHIRTSIADMNTALSNSQAFRVRVANVMPNGLESLPINYDESPGVPATAGQRYLTHRRWVRNSAEAINARNVFAADLVVMFVGDHEQICGVAYTQRPNCGVSGNPAFNEEGCSVGAGYAPFAFSVVSSGCALTEHTFAHEVGHQFGMEHHPGSNAATATNASFPWSYGHWVSTAEVQARSIMSYTTNCTKFGCPIQLHYSNPQVSFQSFPGIRTGVAGADAAGRSRFNARTAVILAREMTNFRGPRVADFDIFGHGFEALPGIVCNPAVWPNCPR